MSNRLIISILFLLAVTAARSQYLDFFQSFSFIQPYQTTRKPDVKRTNTQSNKRYQDSIFFETDDFLKQRENGRTIDPFTTTSKPRRKSKTTRKPTTRSPWYQPEIHEKTPEVNNQINKSNNDNRRVDNYYNYEVTEKQTTQKYYETQKPYFAVAQKPISRPNNRRTTKNPLLHRPGVRPAVVDDNRPPITNRPVTSRPAVPDDTEAEIEIGPDEDDMSEAEKRRLIEITEQKCDEYKSMNKKKVVALPLATIHEAQGVELAVDTCTPINIPLIIGGKVVSIQEFPHMSLVGWKNIQKGGYSWKCGGSLISEQFVLTAGHCTYHDKDYNVISGPPAAIQLGSSYLDGRDSLVISISSVIRHPKYKVRRSYHDVALIKLKTTVSFSESISPACLGVPPPVGDRIIATGWGRTEFGGESSQELRSVAVPIWDMDECREVWGTSRKLPQGPSPASQLCAGERNGGKDTCQGDSGGPAQVQDGCTWRVVAVTSVGRSCGAAETPALYARLPRAFIASQVFTNVKLNRNNSYNGNNNGAYNGNNNGAYNGNNNWGQVNNQNRDEVIRPGNHQTVGNNWVSQGVSNQNNNWGNQGNNQNRDEVTRPGNHQTVNGNNNNNNRPVIHQTTGYNPVPVTSNNNDRENYRPGNHQSIDGNNQNGGYYNNQASDVNRPGNHQTVDSNRGNIPVNYFVTSHTSGSRDTSRLGNHQTVDSNRDVTTGNNFFVTSHTTGNSGNRDTISRPGNHQVIGNNNNSNKFGDSQNSGSNYDAVYSSSSINNNGESYNYKGNNNDNVRNTHTWANPRPETNNNYNNDQNRRTTYSNFGYQNSEYGTTESNSYNENNNRYNTNNNGYNVNNNAGFAVANRPWWSR